MDYSQVTHLLLDLDGTLLHFDLDRFVSRYLELVEVYFRDHYNSKMIPNWILEGTEKMLHNQGEVTNREIFLNYFSKRTGLSEEDIWQRFMNFYENDFNQLEKIIVQNPEARKFLESAKKAGFALTIATQPVFPEIAIRQRLRWAGLDHIEFDLVTDINFMKSCKPYPSYFKQILRILNVDSTDCLMIGDDPVNDMASSEVGIDNYYLGAGPEHTGDFKTLAAALRISL